VTVETNHFNMI